MGTGPAVEKPFKANFKVNPAMMPGMFMTRRYIELMGLCGLLWMSGALYLAITASGSGLLLMLMTATVTYVSVPRLEPIARRWFERRAEKK